MQCYNIDSNTKKTIKVEHFKMNFDCSKCLEDQDDTYIRKFKRKVIKKLSVGENFKIYNSQGLIIHESDLYFLSNGEKQFAIVYVSAQSENFDYETYIKMYRSIQKLGQGGYGQVYLGKHLITKEDSAIKFIMPPSNLQADQAGKAFQEAQLLQSLNHPSIVKLYNVFQLQDTKIVMIMQHIKGGTLAQYLEQKGGKISEQEAQKIMVELGNAISYCHKQNIVHRDIKLDNILLVEAGNIEKGIKIIDFGIAGLIQLTLEDHKTGTLRYCPPELLSGSSYKADPSFDVWSMGILLFRLVFGIFPFEAEGWKDIKSLIIKGNFEFLEDSQSTVSDTCKALIKVMLNKDASKRPKLFQLMNHPWFTGSKASAQLMNQTMFYQNTMMNFFKQELKVLTNKKNDKISDQQPISPMFLTQEKKQKQLQKKSLLSEKADKNLRQKYVDQIEKSAHNAHKATKSIRNNDLVKRQLTYQKQDLDQRRNTRQSLEMKKEELQSLRAFKQNSEDNYIKGNQKKSNVYRNNRPFDFSQQRITKTIVSQTPSNIHDCLSEKRNGSSEISNKYLKSQTIRFPKEQSQMSKAPSITSIRSFHLQNQYTSPSLQRRTENETQGSGIELPQIIKGTKIFDERSNSKSKFSIFKGKSDQQCIYDTSGTGTTQASLLPSDQYLNNLKYKKSAKKEVNDNHLMLVNQLNQKLIEMHVNQFNENQMSEKKKKEEREMGFSSVKNQFSYSFLKSDLLKSSHTKNFMNELLSNY